jgi:hypothetical protein
MAKKKKSTAKAEATVPRSKIIEQCVIYVRQIASYHAGYKADGTGDSQYASAGRQIKKARHAMTRLIALSPHKTPSAPPLTAVELKAKAAVLEAMYGLQKDEKPDDIEMLYIRFFAGEVSDYLASQGVS